MSTTNTRDNEAFDGRTLGGDVRVGGAWVTNQDAGEIMPLVRPSAAEEVAQMNAAFAWIDGDDDGDDDAVGALLRGEQ